MSYPVLPAHACEVCGRTDTGHGHGPFANELGSLQGLLQVMAYLPRGTRLDVEIDETTSMLVLSAHCPGMDWSFIHACLKVGDPAHITDVAAWANSVRQAHQRITMDWGSFG